MKTALAQQRVQLRRLATGDAGTQQSLAVMAEAVRGELPPDYCGFRSEAIRDTARRVCSVKSGHDFRGEIASLFFFVRDRIAYRRDPVDTERVQDPCVTLDLKTGDCDDKCVLLAALLAAMGHMSRFCVQRHDGFFDHVYVEVLFEQTSEWIALDPTADGLNGQPLANVGWRNSADEEWVYAIF